MTNHMRAARSLRQILMVLLACGAPLFADTRAGHAQGIGLQELREMMAWGHGSLVLFEVLEYVPGAADDPVRYDLEGWWGGAYNRLWFKADGEQATVKSEGGTELQLLYGRLIAPFWDAQIGLRMDVEYGDHSPQTRAFLALGVQGLAPYWFELEPSLFISQDGDVSASLSAAYDLLFTQRLVLEPRLDVGAAVQAVPEHGVGEGINDFGLGLRARYEVRREFAPYLGVSWSRRLGATADLARDVGTSVSETSIVAGVRAWW